MDDVVLCNKHHIKKSQKQPIQYILYFLALYAIVQQLDHKAEGT